MVQAGPQSSGRHSCSSSWVWYAPSKRKGESCSCNARVNVSVPTILFMSVPENFGTLLSKQDHLVLHLISIGQLETSFTAHSKEETLRFPHFCPGNVRCFDALMSKQPALKTFSLNNGDVTSWSCTSAGSTDESALVLLPASSWSCWKRVESKHTGRCWFC